MQERFDSDLPVLKKDIEEALNILEQQTYIQRSGYEYEYLTDDEKDVEERLCSMIADSIAPRLVPNIEIVSSKDKTFLVVEVFVSGMRPHWIKSEGQEQGVYVRLGSTNRQADRELIAELGRTAQGISFDEMPMPEFAKEDLDLAYAQEIFGI